MATTVDALLCAKMTFPTYCPRLLGIEGDPRTLAWGAFDDAPTGLLLAGLNDTGQEAEILSIYVRPAARGQGIAKAMLAEAERDLKALGVMQLRITFSATEGNPSTAAVQRMLAGASWSAPQPNMKLLRLEILDRERAFQAPWMQANAWPDGFEVFAWSDLAEAERQYIQGRQQQEGWCPNVVSPWSEVELIEPQTSFGLRWKGLVAGWMVTHRIAADTIRYSYLFISPDVPHVDAGMRLIGTATRAQVLADPPIRYGICAIQAANRFARVAQRRAAQYLTISSVTETLTSSKQLA